MNKNNTKISVQLYADEYKENGLVESVLQKKFGFELSFENSFERNRRILSLEQAKQLRDSIHAALLSYEEAMKFDIESHTGLNTID